VKYCKGKWKTVTTALQLFKGQWLLYVQLYTVFKNSAFCPQGVLTRFVRFSE